MQHHTRRNVTDVFIYDLFMIESPWNASITGTNKLITIFFIYMMRDPYSLFTAIINDFLIIIISLNVARLTHFKIRQGSNSELASS